MITFVCTLSVIVRNTFLRAVVPDQGISTGRGVPLRNRIAAALVAIWLFTSASLHGEKTITIGVVMDEATQADREPCVPISRRLWKARSVLWRRIASAIPLLNWQMELTILRA